MLSKLVLLFVLPATVFMYPGPTTVQLKVKPLFAPIITDVLQPVSSETIDQYSASLKSAKGSSSVNILANTGGRYPYNVYGASSGGTKVDFFGIIRSSYPPYLVPFRMITAESQGRASAYGFYESQTY